MQSNINGSIHFFLPQSSLLPHSTQEKIINFLVFFLNGQKSNVRIHIRFAYIIDVPYKKYMNINFTIIIDEEPLEVRKLNFKNYPGAYEIWKKSEIQFILVHDLDKDINHAWNVDYAESLKVSEEYIDKIIAAINAHYA